MMMMIEYLQAFITLLPDLLPLFYGAIGLGFCLLVFHVGYYLVFGGDERD